jgi:hypothetical protein
MLKKKFQRHSLFPTSATSPRSAHATDVCRNIYVTYADENETNDDGSAGCCTLKLKIRRTVRQREYDFAASKVAETNKLHPFNGRAILRKSTRETQAWLLLLTCRQVSGAGTMNKMEPW